MYALLGGLFVSGKDIITKITLDKMKIDLSIYMFIGLITASIVSFIYQFIKTGNLELKLKDKFLHEDKNRYILYLYVVLIGVIRIVYGSLMGLSTSLAPNPDCQRQLILWELCLPYFYLNLFLKIVKLILNNGLEYLYY